MKGKMSQLDFHSRDGQFLYKKVAWKFNSLNLRCPGRLLNVLCTFNLRPVSTGNVQCMASNSENDNANIEIILHNGKLFAFYFKNIFQDWRK